MLTTRQLRTLRSIDDRQIRAVTMRALLKAGQKLFRFNYDNSNIDTYTFAGFLELPDSKGITSVVYKGGRGTSLVLHHNDLVIDNHLTRDIGLSIDGSYDRECYFLELDFAKRRLKRYIKTKLEKQLENLESK